MFSRVLIIDFGSQYTQLIARRVRESRVYCEIYPCTTPLQKIYDFKPQGLIFSGGPAATFKEGAPLIEKEIYDRGLPVLGICYGMQLTAHLFGGEVSVGVVREYGRTKVFLDKMNPLFDGIPQETEVWMSHQDRVDTVPKGFTQMARTESTPIAGFSDERKKIYGVQFHPEVTHTPAGRKMLENFLFKICSCQPDWGMESFIESKKKEIQKEVGKASVICGVSGGVDSTVAAHLVHEALGEQLTAIFVDNGVLRKDEGQKVKELLERRLKVPLRCVDASERFLKKLKGVEDPEEKRKIIGREFITVFEEEAKKLKGVQYLVQGTLYPDVIESVSFKGPSATIKSHHNVGGLPEKMGLKLLEPFRELFKDEVREIGRLMGLPDDVIYRQPFPGPGLAVRILGGVTPERVRLLQEVDDIVVAEVKKAGWYRKVWQSFSVLLPVKTVGVMGDERTYDHVAAIRAVESQDGMTANWAKLPYELLQTISSRVINEVKGINRVVYDISSKPPATIEWE